jgi:hypothetical protein
MNERSSPCVFRDLKRCGEDYSILKISCTPNLSLTSSPLWEKVIEEKLKQNDLEKFKGVTVKTVEFLPVIIITVFSFLIFKK